MGHTGTLDPFASGILLVGWGEGTKLLNAFEGLDKTYRAKFVFGMSSDSCDPTGVLSEGDPELNSNIEKFLFPLSKDAAQSQKCLDQLVGIHDQTPPLASAVHLNGMRGHELFRKSQESPELRQQLEKEILKKSKQIQILECRHNKIEFEQVQGPLSENSRGNLVQKWTWDFSIKVSKGSYIRALARDIPEKIWGLGPGMLGSLVRTQVGPWDWPDGYSKEKPYLLNQPLQLSKFFCQTTLSYEEAGALESGGRVLPSIIDRLKLMPLSEANPGMPFLLTHEDGIQAWLKPNGEVGRVFLSNPLA